MDLAASCVWRGGGVADYDYVFHWHCKMITMASRVSRWMCVAVVCVGGWVGVRVGGRKGGMDRISSYLGCPVPHEV